MDLGLAGKRVLITGGTHGIGFATAQAFVREGAGVAITGRDEERLAIALHALGPAAWGETIDHMQDDHVLRCQEAWREIDILVNNVGGGGRWSEYFALTPRALRTEIIQKNAGVAWEMTQLYAGGMAARGWGRVVTVSSIYGREAGGQPAFAMAKAAQIALMKSLSLDKAYVRKGVTFNTVAPGELLIEGTGTADERDADLSAFATRLERLPLGRLGTAEEVADLIVFLCSQRAAYINGACIAIDGGEGRAF